MSEVRLIDANALKDIEYINKGNFNTVEGIREWIDNAPTVEINTNDIEYKAYCKGLEDGKKIARPQGEFTRKELESWLYRIASNNLDNELGKPCEEIIGRLDGFERFVSDMRKGGAE